MAKTITLEELRANSPAPELPVEAAPKPAVKQFKTGDIISIDQLKKPLGAPQEDVFLKEHPVLKTVSDILGTTGLARGLAQGIFLKFTDEGKRVLKNVSEGKMTQADFERVMGRVATTKEIAGSAVQTAATVATAGLGAARAPTVAGRILETGAKIGGLSGLSSGAKAFGEDKGGEDIIKETAISGGIGFGLGAAGQSIAELGKLVVSSNTAKEIYNKILGVKPKALEKGKDPAGLLLKEGIGGTRRGIMEKSQKIANEANNEIKTIIKDDPERIASKTILKQIENAVKKRYGNNLSNSQIQKEMGGLPLNQLRSGEFVSRRQLNSIRMVLDKFLGDSKWLNNSSSLGITTAKDAANIMRGIVQKGNEALPALFDRQSNAITAVRSLSAVLSKPHIMTNLLEMVLSGTVGTISGGFTPEGVLKSVATYGLLKGVTSAPTMTFIARAINAASRAGSGPLGQAVSGAAKVGAKSISEQASSAFGGN